MGKSRQNRSHAVMAQRQGELVAQEHEDFAGQSKLDDFPTPPWGTRAFMHYMDRKGLLKLNPRMSVLEPAANRGFMARTLSEFFKTVIASDVHDYGFGYPRLDFLMSEYDRRADWLITNPPFKFSEEFWFKAMRLATTGVALLTRPGFMEGEGRYERIYSVRKPNLIATYSERLPMVKGRCEKMAGTASMYVWSVWLVDQPAGKTEFDWIGPCRDQLEKDGDYDLAKHIVKKEPGDA